MTTSCIPTKLKGKSLWSSIRSIVTIIQSWLHRCCICLYSALFFQVIAELTEKENIFSIEVDELKNIARAVCHVMTDEEFDEMLSYYHDLGVVARHRNLVVLKAQGLVDLFKKLIVIPPDDEQVWYAGNSAWLPENCWSCLMLPLVSSKQLSPYDMNRYCLAVRYLGTSNVYSVKAGVKRFLEMEWSVDASFLDLFMSNKHIHSHSTYQKQMLLLTLRYLG